ncbi:MAG TPA: hypothetical protein ENI85_11330 [Deltaproteobacteria bacterium]|nr:hypothetical protein [Deltaproteobacteria bacterium]
MTRRTVHRLLALVLALVSSGASGGAARADPTVATEADRVALERLQAAVSAHPEDPDLAWAHARRLASVGEAARAIRATRRFVSRWPKRRPAARTEIAALLIEAGAAIPALTLLDEILAEDPDSAEARFYRGLALRRTARVAEADREFEMAGRLQPSLMPEALLARALGLFEQRREEEAVDLLREILRIDPTGDSALRARLLLRQDELLRLSRSWRLDAYAGYEWDDNVTLESSENQVLPSGREDHLGIWGLAATWRTPFHEKGTLTLGYRYDQTLHHDLDDFDLINNTIFVSTSWAWLPRVRLQLDATVYNVLQDLDAELTGGSLRPGVAFALPDDWGALRLLARFEGVEFHDDTAFEPFERDGFAAGLGIEHFLPLRTKGSWISTSGSWKRTLTQAEPGGGSDGFDGDFDFDSWRLRELANLALPFDVEARIEASYTHDRYLNDNLSHAIATLGGLRKREDDILSGRISLSRPIAGHVRIEVYWRGTRRISNVDLFDYDKQTLGVLLRVSTE